MMELRIPPHSMEAEMTDNQIKLMQLRGYQAMPLGAKIRRTEHLIREWYEEHDGMIYLARSGGKDSDVLGDILYKMYPDVPHVHANTGNELNSVKEHVASEIARGMPITIVEPKMSFDEVVKKHGYPVVSKEQSGFIHELKTTNSADLAQTRWFGNKWGRGKISEKWKYLLKAPFDTTHKCCGILKIDPTKQFRKKTGRKTMTGVMADESSLRSQTFIRFGCNAFGMKDPTSRPIIFWTEQDVLQYIKKYDVPMAADYGDIIGEDKLECSGVKRTGCKYCLFGIHLEKGENRIQRLARTEPESYRHCIEELGYDLVMDTLGVEWRSLAALERIRKMEKT
jgi:3'-phosphoadenosine 5'-phosphosulfate sulfotransferase (PAPS reductase)/FAD synthetase